MFCANCGKEIMDGSIFCPECGAAQPGTTPPTAPAPEGPPAPSDQSTMATASYNVMCVVGMVISYVALLLFNPWCLLGIVGTVVSIIGLVSSQEKHERGNNLAVSGIIGGIVATIFTLLFPNPFL